MHIYKCTLSYTHVATHFDCIVDAPSVHFYCEHFDTFIKFGKRQIPGKQSPHVDGFVQFLRYIIDSRTLLAMY
jgi:hypothetical protein